MNKGTNEHLYETDKGNHDVLQLKWAKLLKLIVIFEITKKVYMYLNLGFSKGGLICRNMLSFNRLLFFSRLFLTPWFFCIQWYACSTQIHFCLPLKLKKSTV